MKPGKTITLKELQDRDIEKRRRFYESDEGKAQAERNHQKFLEEEKARLAWEKENPPTPYAEGVDAALRHEPNDPPSGLTAEDQRMWLEGWYSVVEDDEP